MPKENMYFVGIDLAWSSNNSSGLAIIEGDETASEIKYLDVAGPDEEIIDTINQVVNGSDAIVAIDAPLIVPNETGRRLADALVSNTFRKYHAGSHPANRPRLMQKDGTIRGEVISGLLKKAGYLHSPYVQRGERTKKFFEVYPHPAMVVLFRLDSILKYKAKPQRDYEFRWTEFDKYKDGLLALGEVGPSLNTGSHLDVDVRTLKGGSLKAYEDKLDGLFCAYIGQYVWQNPQNCAVLGNMQEGYMVTPLFEDMKASLADYLLA